MALSLLLMIVGTAALSYVIAAMPTRNSDNNRPAPGRQTDLL